MIRINKRQYEAFEAVAFEQFLTTEVGRLRDSFGNAGVVIDRDYVSARCRQAQEFGFKERGYFSHYLDLATLAGPEFPHASSYAWARALLSDASRDPRARLAAVEARLA